MRSPWAIPDDPRVYVAAWHRVFPPISDGKTYQRDECGALHWWPVGAKEGEPCFCGKEKR